MAGKPFRLGSFIFSFRSGSLFKLLAGKPFLRLKLNDSVALSLGPQLCSQCIVLWTAVSSHIARQSIIILTCDL